MRFLISLAAVALMATAAHAGPWSGCYGGAHLGYSAVVSDDDFGAQGSAYGVVGGCDVQMNNIVVGGWGDYTWGENWDGASFDGRWGIGVRAGALLNPYALAYGKLGWTQADVEGIDMDGIVWGGGIELAVSDGWHGALDYQYVDYDDVFGEDIDQHIARIVFTYRVNWSKSPFSNSLK